MEAVEPSPRGLTNADVLVDVDSGLATAESDGVTNDTDIVEDETHSEIC